MTHMRYHILALATIMALVFYVAGYWTAYFRYAPREHHLADAVAISIPMGTYALPAINIFAFKDKNMDDKVDVVSHIAPWGTLALVDFDKDGDIDYRELSLMGLSDRAMPKTLLSGMDTTHIATDTIWSAARNNARSNNRYIDMNLDGIFDVTILHQDAYVMCQRQQGRLLQPFETLLIGAGTATIEYPDGTRQGVVFDRVAGVFVPVVAVEAQHTPQDGEPKKKDSE